MANMLDYLDWRGDLTFGQSPFNMVDNMLLSYLAYVNLDGIPEITGENSASIKEVSEAFFRMHSEEELNDKAVAFDKIVKGWIAGMDEAQKGMVVEDLFSLLEATGADTLTEIQNQGIRNLPAIFKQIETLHAETKDHVADLVKAVAAHWKDWI